MNKNNQLLRLIESKKMLSDIDSDFILLNLSRKIYYDIKQAQESFPELHIELNFIVVRLEDEIKDAELIISKKLDKKIENSKQEIIRLADEGIKLIDQYLQNQQQS